MLKTYYENTIDRYEIGIDEAGRGPLFGRLYVAAVVLPKETDSEFHHERMKDSKKFHSKKKIREVAEYIKSDAIAWSVQFVEAAIIDEINIRQSVFRGMHACIRDIIQQTEKSKQNDPLLLVDGNDFRPYTVYDENTEEIRIIPFETIEGGDNKYTAIAAASILAKVAHDDYIADICSTYPELVSRYGLDKNVGYGTKQHLQGIAEYGITQWHRRTFGQHCRNATITTIMRECDADADAPLLPIISSDKQH